MPQRAPDGTIPAQPQAPHRTGLAEDYAALEAALSAFPRGRWFLAEYARRSRTAETDMLLEAIARLDTAVLKPQRQEAAEEIQEVAWTLRERGTDIQLCDKIDQRATDIYTPAPSRTSPGSGPARWCGRSASSSSASTP
jgi:hypothetical protein